MRTKGNARSRMAERRPFQNLRDQETWETAFQPSPRNRLIDERLDRGCSFLPPTSSGLCWRHWEYAPGKSPNYPLQIPQQYGYGPSTQRALTKQ